MLGSRSRTASQRKKLYRIFAIKSLVADKYYLGITSTFQAFKPSVDADGSVKLVENTDWSTKLRINKFIYDEYCKGLHGVNPANGDSPVKFNDIGKSIAEHGLAKHTVSLLKEIYDDRDLAEQDLYRKQLKLSESGKLINTNVISPEKALCESCGKKVRLAFMEDHKAKYCTTIDDFLNDL